jgi:hypothetical protein
MSTYYKYFLDVEEFEAVSLKSFSWRYYAM